MNEILNGIDPQSLQEVMGDGDAKDTYCENNQNNKSLYTLQEVELANSQSNDSNKWLQSLQEVTGGVDDKGTYCENYQRHIFEGGHRRWSWQTGIVK